MSEVPVHPAPSPLKAVGWTIAFLAFGFALTIGFAQGLFVLSGLQLDPGHPSPGALAIQSVAGLAGFAIATWLIGVRALRLTTEELRWTPLSRAGKGFALGLLVGLLPALTAILLSVPLGHAEFLSDHSGGASAYLQQVGVIGLVLLPAALLEELAFRGVGQVLLAKAFGRIPALVALSVLFAMAHVFNPNPTALGLTNIALAGVFLGLAFYTPGGIWTAWGAHLGWNLTLAALDTPVSGWPFQMPWIDYLPGQPNWLTGGNFGPEGGLLASLAIAAMSATIWHKWIRKENA